ncbi:hypothetical protein ACFQ9X_15825 [Catenulispora yoronensis]
MGLSAVAVLGVAGAATSALAGLGSGSSGGSGSTSAAGGADAANPANAAAANNAAAAGAAAAPAPARTAVTTSAAATTDLPALLKKDLQQTLPSGVYVIAVQASTQDHTAKVHWNWSEDPTGLGGTVAVTRPSTPTTCAYFHEIATEKHNAQPDCTVTPLPGGGSFLSMQEQGKTALPTSLYLNTYTYFRPDGRELTLYQMQYGSKASRISEDQARTMLTSPVWDSAAVQVGAK